MIVLSDYRQFWPS